MMDYPKMEDNQLWMLLVEGDKNALKEIYYRHYNLLYHYGLKFCGNEESVKDCIHDIFLKIFNNKHLAAITYVRTYLLKSLKNLLLEEARKKENFNREEFNDKIDIVEDELSDVAFFKQDDEALRLSLRIAKAYKQLNKNQQQIIYLRFVKELSFNEIADLLGINVQSAMNLSSRTIAKIRSILTNDNLKIE